MTNPNQLNIYVCSDCGLHIVTKDVDKGVTPFLIGCQCTFGCNGRMQSSMYRVFDPDGKMRHTHEWYKPTIILDVSPALHDHVKKGGLLLRRRLDNPQAVVANAFTHRHKKRGTSYRVIGDVRLQLSADAKRWTPDQLALDGLMFMLYQGEDAVYSARHPAEFNDGRFELIT